MYDMMQDGGKRRGRAVPSERPAYRRDMTDSCLIGSLAGSLIYFRLLDKIQEKEKEGYVIVVGLPFGAVHYVMPTAAVSSKHTKPTVGSEDSFPAHCIRRDECFRRGGVLNDGDGLGLLAGIHTRNGLYTRKEVYQMVT